VLAALAVDLRLTAGHLQLVQTRADDTHAIRSTGVNWTVWVASATMSTPSEHIQ
jgi:hypothetical protein